MRSYDGASQVDFDASTYWVTHVLDDATQAGVPVRFWKDEFLDIPDWPRYDQYGAIDPNTGQPVRNRHVWVRAEAACADRTRAIVAWVRDRGPPDRVPPVRGARRLRGREELRWPRRPAARELHGFARDRRALHRNAAATVGLRRPRPHQGSAASARPRTSTTTMRARAAIERSRPPALEDVAKCERHLVRGLPGEPERRRGLHQERGHCQYTNSAPVAAGRTKCCNSPVTLAC